MDLPFNKSLIPYEVIESVIPIIRMNVNRKDEDILNRYLPEILKIREIYSNQNKYENITKLVNKIYLSPTHNFKDSFFDQKGKHLEKLYYDRHNWYGFGTNKSDSMLAIGAFGFNDPKGIFFLAFHRLISHIEGLKNKKDWRSLDFLLPQLIENSYDLATLYVWMINDNLIHSKILIQAAPLIGVIPCGELILYKNSFNDKSFESYVKNIYPNLRYKLIE